MKYRALTPDILVSENMLILIEKKKEDVCPTWKVKLYHWLLEEPKERHFTSERDADDFIGFLTDANKNNSDN